MSRILFDQENPCPHPTGLRQRLQSAPDKIQRTSAGAKNVHAPLQPGRKALGTVNTVPNRTPSRNLHKQLKPQETQEKVIPKKSEKYPDIDNFIPYDPLEFEKYSISEDLLPLSMLALPGLAQYPQSCLPQEAQEAIDFYNLSPVKMPKADYCPELEDFLHTLETLTVQLPQEPDFD